MRATTNEASRTSSGYRTVPRLDIPDESLWEIYPQQEMSFAGYRTVPRLDIPCKIEGCRGNEEANGAVAQACRGSEARVQQGFGGGGATDDSQGRPSFGAVET